MTPEELLKKLKVEVAEEGGRTGKFVFEPLPVGYGQTIGNALRRILLSSLAGVAVTYVKMEGVTHQFGTVAGVKEDVLDLIHNFKKIRLRIFNNQPLVLRIETNGPKKVLASDFEVVGSGEVVNKDLEIANLADRKTKFVVELTAEVGFGYLTAEEHPAAKIGVIPIDSIFTPVRHVSYKVEQARLGQLTNLDRLVLELTTDGTVSPSQALKEAARVLISFFKTISGDAPVSESAEKVEEDDREKITEADRAVLTEDLGLSTRTTNALLKAKFKSLGDLLEKSSEDLTRTKGLGEKGVAEIVELLKKHGWR